MSKTGVKQAWCNVADELAGLSLKLKYHVQEEFSDDDGDDVKSAIDRLAEAIDDTVEAAGNAAKDPAVREDLKATGKLLTEALHTTVDEAVRGVRNAVPRAS
ncbi:MAG: hypothetical protein ACI8TP_000980 [Acidimicrobiales bacterium]|jgi:hypothetical protein